MSRIVLNFNSIPTAPSILEIVDSFRPTEVIRLSFQNNLNIDNLIPLPTIDQNINQVQNFINANYNSIGIYVLTPDYINKTLTLESRVPASQFSEQLNTTSGAITIGVDNDVFVPAYEILFVTYTAASADQCNFVSATITTNRNTASITSPINQVISNLTTFSVDVPRNQNLQYSVVSEDAVNHTRSQIDFIPLLIPANFTININNTPSGGNISVTNNFISSSNITLEYSLNNVDFFSSSSFTGVPEGNNTLYIRDNYNCNIQIDFAVNAFVPNVEERQEISFLSNLNSLRYKLCEDLNTVSKNPNNTLSFEEDAEATNRNYSQPYEKTDGILTEQIRSSYQTITATLIDCFKNETPLVVNKVSNNSNLTDVRDGLIRSVSYLGDSYVGVQANIGNIYNPNTLAVTDTYNIGNILPDFVNTDDLINVQSLGWYKVVDIIFENGVQTAVLNLLTRDLSFTINQNGDSRRITSIYNQLPYELHEFNLDLSNLDGYYQVKIELTDTDFTKKEYLSEYIEVRETHAKTHLIEWYNTTNTEINWNTGKRSKARYKYVFNMKYAPNVSQDIVITDTKTILLDAMSRQTYALNLFPVPFGIAEKFHLICSQDRVFVDGLPLVREQEPEHTSLLGSNLYKIDQVLTLGDFKFEQGINVDTSNLNNLQGLFTTDEKNGLLLIN